MSLYDAAPSNSNIKALASIGGRPKWLTVLLALAVFYAIAAFTQLIVHNQERKTDQERSIAKMREINEPLRNLRGNSEIMAKLDGIVTSMEVSLRESQAIFPKKLIIRGFLVIISAIYLFKPIAAIGFLAASIWFVSLLSLCSYIFSMNIPAAAYFLVLPNIGIRDLGSTGAVVQIVIPIAIFLFSSIKFKKVL